jgi:hypothetical protein
VVVVVHNRCAVEATRCRVHVAGHTPSLLYALARPTIDLKAIRAGLQRGRIARWEFARLVERDDLLVVGRCRRDAGQDRVHKGGLWFAQQPESCAYLAQ